MSEKGRSQIQMMLMQQAGPGSLALTSLSLAAFTGFVRKAEDLIISEKLAPIVVYWSSRDASRLAPDGDRLRKLKKDCFGLASFSEDRQDLPDELCFIVEGQELCLIAYGQLEASDAADPHYKCAGSVEPQLVRQCLSTLLPLFQFIDPVESNNIEDGRANLGPRATAPQYVKTCRADWPVIKLTTQEWSVLQSTPQEFEQKVLDATMRAAEETAAGLTQGLAAQAVSGSDYGSEVPVPVSEPDSAGLVPQMGQPVAGAAPAGQETGERRDDSPIPVAAQKIIKEIISQLRHSNDLGAILQLAIERLTRVTNADRGLIWQVAGSELCVTHEYASDGHNCFTGNELGSDESAAVMLEFLSRFPDESGVGVISVADTMQDTKLHKLSQTLASLVELGEVRARLVSQLRCRGVFSGFLELQQCRKTRNWSEHDAALLQSVAEVLSVVVQQSYDQTKIENDLQERNLINEIANLFRESEGEKSKDMLVQSVDLVAGHMGFAKSQIYLFSEEDGELLPQVSGHGDNAEAIALEAKDNPFVAVYESGREKIYNNVYTRKADPYFGHDVALVVPLMSEGEKMGVLGLWERLPGRPPIKPQEQELAWTVSGQLASHIRADRAIARIREDRVREHLINEVSDEIRESLKEVDQIMGTLVKSLHDYFKLDLCVVSLFDKSAQDFTKSKTAGPDGLIDADDSEGDDGKLGLNLGEQLCLAMVAELKAGNSVFLRRNEIKAKLKPVNVAVPDETRSATLVPLVYGGQFKAALCMVSNDRDKPFPEKDRNMVKDLADRVAVVVSHAELFAQVEKQAVTDPMTGLFNRRHFAEEMSKELDRYHRFGRPFSYIIVDLDYLKKINDTLGHQFGDEAIKHISVVLKQATRDVDTAARYGGEEFVVLLPETDAIAARIVAERICASIREKPVEGIGTITASVGVSTFPADTQDREKLTELADQALYLAKHRGRNQVCSVSEDLMPSLKERGEEALEVQKAAIKAKAEEMASIDIKLIAEHGILGIMGAIIKIIEARDAYSKERSPRAAEYASKLAQSLHLSKEHITIISLSAILHNVGKIALPEEILQKKGPLTEEERRIVQQSPTIGKKILEPAKHLHRVASVIESYHEHWDGTGYPRGLAGEDIPLESRIIALVDAYIAMTSDRPYRKALSHDQAVSLIKEGSGKEWDPRLVKLFLSILQKESAKAKSTK